MAFAFYNLDAQVKDVDTSEVQINYDKKDRKYKKNARCKKLSTFLIFEKNFDDTIDVYLDSNVIAKDLVLKTMPNLSVCHTSIHLENILNREQSLTLIFGGKERIEISLLKGYRSIYINQFYFPKKKWFIFFSNEERDYY